MTNPPSNRPGADRPLGNRPTGSRPGATPPGGRPAGAGPTRPASPIPPGNRALGSRPGGHPDGAAARPNRTMGPGSARRGGQRGDDDNRRLILLAIAGIAVVVVLLLVGINILGGKPAASPIGVAGTSAFPYGSGATASGAAATPAAPTAVASQGAGGGTGSCPTAAPEPWKAGDAATVTLATAKGNIVIALKGELAPHATANFAALAACGFYDGVVFHRLVPGFVIQGGDGQFGRDPDVNPGRVGTGGPGYTIPDDKVTAPYKRGVLAMARTAEPNSQGSQFFVVLSDEAADALAAYNTYAIMGEVTEGMAVVDEIAAMPNAGSAKGNAAIDPLPIIKATVARP